VVGRVVADGSKASVGFDGEREGRELTDFLDFVFEPCGGNTSEDVSDDCGGSGVEYRCEVGGGIDEHFDGGVMEAEGADDGTLTGVVVNGNEDEAFVFILNPVDKGVGSECE
jgi:hypothetical protein